MRTVSKLNTSDLYGSLHVHCIQCKIPTKQMSSIRSICSMWDIPSSICNTFMMSYHCPKMMSNLHRIAAFWARISPTLNETLWWRCRNCILKFSSYLLVRVWHQEVINIPAGMQHHLLNPDLSNEFMIYCDGLQIGNCSLVR